MDKRTFLKSLLLGSAGVFAIGAFSSFKAARSRKKWDGIFKMPELPYSLDSLDSFVDHQTLDIHYNVHFASFTRDLNKEVALAGLTGITAHQLLKESSKYSAQLVTSGAGYVNHKLFWRILTPSRGHKPSHQLVSAINRSFGSFEKMKTSFLEKSASMPGQGWMWLIAGENGNLRITSTSGEDNPLMDSAPEKGFPLLCLDMWDHASSTSRDLYVTSFWNVVNWEVVSRRYSFSVARNDDHVKGGLLLGI